MSDPQAKASFLKAARGVLAYLEMYGEKYWTEMVTHALSFEGPTDKQMYELYFGFHRSTGGINTLDLAKSGANPHDAEQFRNMSIVAYRLAFFLKDGKPIRRVYKKSPARAERGQLVVPWILPQARRYNFILRGLLGADPNTAHPVLGAR